MNGESAILAPNNLSNFDDRVDLIQQETLRLSIEEEKRSSTALPARQDDKYPNSLFAFIKTLNDFAN